MSLRFCIISIVFFSYQYAIGQIEKDPRNFYGICWRGNSSENIKYAKSMGYDFVFYQGGMEDDINSKGLGFYLETPEYMIYPRKVDVNKEYSEEEKAFYERYCALGDSNKKFPYSLASGWFFNENHFSAQLDFSKDFVIDWAIEEILKKIKEIEKKNPNFKFSGLAWDVPQLTGDFGLDTQKTKESWWTSLTLTRIEVKYT
jgi:hypothetical protein